VVVDDVVLQPGMQDGDGARMLESGVNCNSENWPVPKDIYQNFQANPLLTGIIPEFFSLFFFIYPFFPVCG
jgi:hypothetical protein